jgi:hypothetical protein
MRKSSSGIIKWVVILVVLFFGWTKGLPWLKQQKFFSSPANAASEKPSCTELAAAASESWGNGIAPFVNPPVDRSAWDSFRSDVERRIDKAKSECRCNAESCTKAADAMDRLRKLVSTLDASVQSGAAPPPDLPQQQEQIDSLIDAAQSLVREGK